MYHDVGEERLLRRGRGGGCLRVDHGMGAAVLECSCSIQVDYIKGQISGFVLHKLDHGCRPYDFF